MSRLQRRLIDSKVPSNGPSRQSSRPGSRSSSVMGSRIHSDDEDEYTSVAFLNSEAYADALAEGFDKLLGLEDGEKIPRDRFSESIEILNTDRRNTSLEARELALRTVVSIISQKYEPEKLDHTIFEIFEKSFRMSRSEIESLLSLQAICIYAAASIEDSFESITMLLPKVFNSLSNESMTITIRANMALAYSLLQYFVHYGSGAFKADEVVEELVDLAGECNADESPLASAALLGAGLITSIIPNPNNVIENLLDLFIDMLDKSSVDIKLAAGKVIALYFQIYGYQLEDDDGINEIPMIDVEELLLKLDELLAESSKKIKKKDKREQKSLFRDVIKTVRLFSNEEARSAITEEDLLITHIKISRSKSLTIDSWKKLLLVQHYKWIYGAGIHTQIANNAFIQASVRDTDYVPFGEYKYSSLNDPESPGEPAEEVKSDIEKRHKDNTLQRTKLRNAQRRDKYQHQAEALDYEVEELVI